MRYQINRPSVLDEIIEHEVILIDLDKGVYYNTEHAGADIWRGLKSGWDDAAIAEYIACRYSIGTEMARKSVDDFIRTLESEQLIIKDPEARGGRTMEPRLEETGAPLPFELPRIFKYTDLKELLLLDPIHDIDTSERPPRTPENGRPK
ncbi:MAG: hypothetical protein MOGMAGMI_01675 [Candidatus Omnitrophica bacterium]|nr:hypothetical protein [Candidatus Omnitrophota bacterium]